MIKLSSDRGGQLPGLIYSVGNTDRSSIHIYNILDVPVSRETREEQILERARGEKEKRSESDHDNVRSNVFKETSALIEKDEEGLHQQISEQSLEEGEEEEEGEPMTIREMIEDAKVNPIGSI